MRRGGAALAIWLLFPAAALAVPGAVEVRSGNRAYKKGAYREALEHYQAASFRAPQDPVVAYDLGAALYREQRYGEAIDRWREALLSENPELQRRARFALGNGFYRRAAARENEDLQAAIQDMEKSLGHYDQYLKDFPADKAAEDNRVRAAQELERLKKKQPPPQRARQASSPESREGEKSDRKDSSERKDASAKAGEAKPSSDDGAAPADASAGQGPQAQRPAPPAQGPDGHSPEASAKNPSSVTAVPAASAGQEGRGDLLSEEAAEALLQEFEQQEQPQGLLHVRMGHRNEKPVGKDW